MFPFLNIYPLYRGMAHIAPPLLHFLLRSRLGNKKELASRVKERHGKYQQMRPKGNVIWLHAASNGEAKSTLPLIHYIQKERPDITIILTSTTLSAIEIMEDYLPKGVIHLFAPFDVPRWVERFLNHWRPQAALFFEQEIWPNTITTTAKRQIPVYLVNGRISNQSFYRWRLFRNSAREVFGKITMGFAQDQLQASRLRHLGIQNTVALGDAKADAQPLNIDDDEAKRFKNIIGDRPCFMAVSTHHGEEEIILNIHKQISRQIPNLFTIIVPRKPERGVEIENLITSHQLTHSKRSQAQLPSKNDDVFLADSFGEMGLYLHLSDVAFIGGSLIPGIGGHNPIEAANMNVPIIMGPSQENCRANAQLLAKYGALKEFATINQGAKLVSDILTDDEVKLSMQTGAKNAMSEMPTVTKLIYDHIKDILPPKS